MGDAAPKGPPPHKECNDGGGERKDGEDGRRMGSGLPCGVEVCVEEKRRENKRPIGLRLTAMVEVCERINERKKKADWAQGYPAGLMCVC